MGKFIYATQLAISQKKSPCEQSDFRYFEVVYRLSIAIQI